MFKQKPFPFSLIALAVVISLHIVGSYYSLYWIYPWFDALVHAVGGLWIGSVFLWLASVLGQISTFKEYKIKSFLIALIPAILIGVIWEILENLSHVVSVSADNYNLNTALDLLNDAVGGALAYLYSSSGGKRLNRRLRRFILSIAKPA